MQPRIPYPLCPTNGDIVDTKGITKALPVFKSINIQIQRFLLGSMKMEPNHWKVINVLESKKNTVFRIQYEGKYYIAKKYAQEFAEGLNREHMLLKECKKKGLFVPEVVDVKENMLILEYIPGVDCKKLFDTDKKEAKTFLSGIAEWLSEFHSSFGLRKRRGDCILSNFILFDAVIYGIDFEESADEHYLRDVADMCTSVLRMEPSFTRESFNYVDHFIGEYFNSRSGDRTDLTANVVESLLHYSEYGSQGEKMKKWAARIKEIGLDNILRS